MQRYAVDLSEIFSDHRQRVIVGRRKTWQRVGCLLDHLRSVVQIETGIYLTNGENFLFPEAEELDVIQESDQLRVHSSSASNSLKSTQRVCAPKSVPNANGEEPRAVATQNGKRKHASSPIKPVATDEQSSSAQNGKKRKRSSPMKPPNLDEESSSAESDDEASDPLPKIFAGLETLQQKDTSVEELTSKSKRKRVRKRKAKKKKKAEETPPKVVVKTYGKSNVPPIVENGHSATHVRFDDKEKEKSDNEVDDKNEPYKNLNQNTIPRIVKAIVQPSTPLDLNEDLPAVPEYDDVLDLEIDDILNSKRSKKRAQMRKPKEPVEIKRELIEANTSTLPQPALSQSPTWDNEVDQAKESFLANYTGEEFWTTLQDALDNFPTITIPSKNDVISYRFIANADNQPSQAYLAFVERADDGESDDMPALKLSLRRLDVAGGPRQTATLDQLTGIRLIATYQP